MTTEGHKGGPRNADSCNHKSTHSILYKGISDASNPFQRGDDRHTDFFLTQLKKQYIQARLFVTMNMDKVETAMEESRITEQEYIITLDTLMVISNIILPKAKSDIVLIENRHKEWTSKVGEFFRKYTKLFQEIWVGRSGSHTSGNNLMEIGQVAGMYQHASLFWKSKGKENAPVLLHFKAKKELENLKSIMPKWKAEYQSVADKYLAELSKRR